MAQEYLVIHKIFSNTVSKFPGQVCLQIKKDNTWLKITYKDLEAASLRVANFLIKEGLKKGDCAGIILENRPQWPIIYLGIMYAGLTAVPLDPQLSPQEIKNLIIDSSAKITFCSYNIFMEKIKQNIEEHLTKFVVLDALDLKPRGFVNFSDIESILPQMNALPEVLPQDFASLIYTSGTTAKPKGVLLSHKNICSNFSSLAKLNICSSADNIFSILPLYHTYAFMGTLILPLLLGARVTYFNLSFKPQDLIRIIKEARVTMLVAVPQLFSLLHKAISEKIKNIPFLLIPFILPFIKNKVQSQLGGALRLFVSGGARLEPKIAKDLSRLTGIKIIEGYGLTETSPVVTLNPVQNLKFGSVGIPLPDVQIKILEPDKPCPSLKSQTALKEEPGKSGVGQVLIKGPNVMQGYFKQPELTSQVIKDGWFYSGDLGFIDKEGYLFITGRKEDVIVLSSGKNIYPEELEEYYSQTPYIKEICILSQRQERFGHLVESLYAVIVPNLEYFRQRNVADIKGKIRWELENLSRSLPSYKHIMGFTLTKEELPRTVLKKLKRYQVRQKYLEGKLLAEEIKETVFSPEDLEILNKDITKKVISYISRELNRPVYLDSHLEIDLGIDSLTRVDLGLGLEAQLNLKIPDELLYSVSTVKEIVINILGLIEKKQALMPGPKETQKDWSQILKELPPKAILEKIKIRASLLDKVVTLIFKSIFLFIFRIFWFLRIEGKKFLPVSGPYILCSNHASYLDGFVVFTSLRFSSAMNTFFLGYSQIFEHPSVSWAIKSARLIPMDPNMHLTEAMQALSFVLRHKKIICIFPEGRRSIDENIGEFKKGIGILIKELDVPVVPVYIKGSHPSWPRGRRLPRFYPLKIIFGPPVYLKELIKRKKESELDDYEIIAANLREEVLKILDLFHLRY